MGGKQFGPPVVMGDESIMSKKAHGTSAVWVLFEVLIVATKRCVCIFFYATHLLTYLLTHYGFHPFVWLFVWFSFYWKKSPVQDNLRWDCDKKTASNICNFNRHYAEHSGYFEGKSKFLAEAKASSKIEFFDSNTGKLLYTAPIGRTMDDFLIESKAHGK